MWTNPPPAPRWSSCVKRWRHCLANAGFCVSAEPWTAAGAHGSLPGPTRTALAVDPSPLRPSGWALNRPCWRDDESKKHLPTSRPEYLKPDIKHLVCCTLASTCSALPPAGWEISSRRTLKGCRICWWTTQCARWTGKCMSSAVGQSRAEVGRSVPHPPRTDWCKHLHLVKVQTGGHVRKRVILSLQWLWSLSHPSGSEGSGSPCGLPQSLGWSSPSPACCHPRPGCRTWESLKRACNGSSHHWIRKCKSTFYDNKLQLKKEGKKKS